MRNTTSLRVLRLEMISGANESTIRGFVVVMEERTYSSMLFVTLLEKDSHTTFHRIILLLSQTRTVIAKEAKNTD
jgi:hypothetical protein